MGKKLYVGNLPFSTNDQTLQNMFSEFGSIESARVITDRESGRSKGFGFVELGDADAATAIEKLNGTEIDGRKIIVNEARPMAPREGGGGGGRGFGGGRGGGGGFGGGRGGGGGYGRGR
jgi:RNA recognition motif-containing protein